MRIRSCLFRQSLPQGLIFRHHCLPTNHLQQSPTGSIHQPLKGRLILLHPRLRSPFSKSFQQLQNNRPSKWSHQPLGKLSKISLLSQARDLISWKTHPVLSKPGSATTLNHFNPTGPYPLLLHPPGIRPFKSLIPLISLYVVPPWLV